MYSYFIAFMSAELKAVVIYWSKRYNIFYDNSDHLFLITEILMYKNFLLCLSLITIESLASDNLDYSVL